MNSLQGFTAEQEKQIKLGRKHHIDVTSLLNPELSPEQMGIIRVALESGVDAKLIARPDLSEERMYVLLNFLMDKLPIEQRFFKQCSVELVQFIYYCYKRDLNYNTFPYALYNKEQLKELSRGLVQGLDIREFCNPDISAYKMQSIRLDMVNEKRSQNKYMNN